MKNDLEIFKNSSKDDGFREVEAQIVEEFSNSDSKTTSCFFDKIRTKFGKTLVFILLPISIVFIIVGFILSSTIIGAILGIPMILLGLFLLWILYKTIFILFKIK